MSRLSAILPACLLLAAQADAQPLNGAGSPPELGQALVQAYLYNPQLAAERKLLRQTDEGVPRALSGWRPTVSLSVAAGTAAVFDNLDPKHSPERRVPQLENLQLTQPLYTGGRVGAQVKQADALVAPSARPASPGGEHPALGGDRVPGRGARPEDGGTQPEPGDRAREDVAGNRAAARRRFGDGDRRLAVAARGSTTKSPPWPPR